jgi:ABC-type sugar transport system ATPase subunit
MSVNEKPAHIAARPEVLSVHNASKHFGPVTALEDVSLTLHQGEVLALMGDNGAGKSTLIKALSGVHPIDTGYIEIDGAVVNLGSPAVARSMGIETVYQDLALFDNLSPADNFFAGRELARFPFLPTALRPMRRAEMRKETARLLDDLKVTLPPGHSTVGLLSGGQRQAVAVARAAAFATKVVILDEPTAALGLRESRKVLDLIKRLKDRGIGIILISHSMDHVMEVADSAIVLRRGQRVGHAIPSRETQQELVSLIVGGGATAAA